MNKNFLQGLITGVSLVAVGAIVAIAIKHKDDKDAYGLDTEHFWDDDDLFGTNPYKADDDLFKTDEEDDIFVDDDDLFGTDSYKANDDLFKTDEEDDIFVEGDEAWEYSDDVE